MTTSRRKFLTLIGGGTVVAATGMAASFLATRTPTLALEPWAAAGTYDDPRLRAMSYALLAPNPHNRQPWLAELDGSNTVILRMDPDRRLPETDPYERQLVIGMGCFVELMVQAAADERLAVDLSISERSGPNETPEIRARFRDGGTPDPLFAAVMDRRSCKEPFDMDRPVGAEVLAPVLAAADGFAMAGPALSEADVAPLRQRMWDAWVVEIQTERTYVESVDLFRIGKRQIEANPDGIDLGGPMLEVLKLAGQLDREDMLNPDSMAYTTSWEMYREMLAATPAAVWLTTPGNSRNDQLNAGRAWVRMNLAATFAGLSLHPVSQMLQEYPEMAEHYAWAHENLAGEGETVQMLGRIGYGPQVAQTPRWPLETRIISG